MSGSYGATLVATLDKVKCVAITNNARLYWIRCCDAVGGCRRLFTARQSGPTDNVHTDIISSNE